MFSGNVESVMKLSVISPNTTHKRGSVVPLTIAITEPTQMSNLSQPSAKRNYKTEVQQSTAVRYRTAPCQSDLARLAFGSLNRSIEWVGGNFFFFHLLYQVGVEEFQMVYREKEHMRFKRAIML